MTGPKLYSKDIIRESPKFPRANYNLGLLCEEQGRLEEARAAYTQEVTEFPQEFQARFNLGQVLLKLGDHAGYMDSMRKVVDLAPQQAEGYLFLARGLSLEQAPLDEIRVMVEKRTFPRPDVRTQGPRLFSACRYL